MKCWPIIGALALLVTSCVRAHGRDDVDAGLAPQTELEARVAAADDAAWRAAGLRTVDGTYTMLDELRIVEVATIEEYRHLCPSASWDCCAIRYDVPIVYVSPLLPRGLIAHAASHCQLHLMGYSYGRWANHFDAKGRWNPYDSTHEDTWVWEVSPRPDSVETRAERILDD
jgi:hypothetical protein